MNEPYSPGELEIARRLNMDVDEIRRIFDTVFEVMRDLSNAKKGNTKK